MGIIDRMTDRRRLVLTQRLQRLPVWGHPALRVRFYQEGFSGYVFGCRAGPSIAFSHLAHDLAHAVQFGPDAFEKRVDTLGRFKFKCHQVYIGGIGYDEPRTDQCTRREAETAAIQLHLLEMAGVKTWRPDYATRAARAFEFLPDWYHFERETRERVIASMLDHFYSQWSKAQVVDALTAWFDAQAVRMRRRVASQHVAEADIFFSTPKVGKQAQRTARPMVTA